MSLESWHGSGAYAQGFRSLGPCLSMPLCLPPMCRPLKLAAFFEASLSYAAGWYSLVSEGALGSCKNCDIDGAG